MNETQIFFVIVGFIVIGISIPSIQFLHEKKLFHVLFMILATISIFVKYEYAGLLFAFFTYMCWPKQIKE